MFYRYVLIVISREAATAIFARIKQMKND